MSKEETVKKPYKAYSNEVYKDLMEPYNKDYNSLEYGNMDIKDKLSKTSVDCDWETAFLITDEGKEKDRQRREYAYKTRIQETVNQGLKELIINALIEEETMDRSDEILAALSRIESNTQQYSQPAHNHSTWVAPKTYSTPAKSNHSHVQYTGKVETDHSRMMSQVKQVNNLRKKQW